MHLHCYEIKLHSLKWKTRPKQLLGSLPLYITLLNFKSIIYLPKVWMGKMGSMGANGREPKSCLGQVFYFMSCSFSVFKEVRSANTRLCWKLSPGFVLLAFLSTVRGHGSYCGVRLDHRDRSVHLQRANMHCWWIECNRSGNTKGGSITVLLTSCLTGLD